MAAPKEIVFMSQSRAEAYDPRPTDAIISITDRDKPPADLYRGWCAELRISFDDVNPIEFPVDPDEGLLEIQEEQIQQIATFVLSLPENCETVAVHCRFGQSRSAGVARAVCHHFGLYFPPDYDCFNNFVFTRVRDALRSKSGAELGAAPNPS
ncbi:dual specificity protein phosphatase family protein [Gemmata sp. G18]|uniref:Dual specificity protein phosphatase family protein n=1 Tax=Gemmata palustris TaxID=2822762 RepID=A0ABS5BRC9_9BACT|nr:dual specificity protein phosphatase family protein [Gemmata palustris]MBP3956283.1 dual specificity protein phosphatase family protein [Gemmata palustris]